MKRSFDLLTLLVKKEITLKYKRTYLGMIWSLLNPLLTAAVLFIAFRIIMRFNMENYTLFLLSALFPWTWFSASVMMSTTSLTQNVSLIKKVLFPRHFLIIATIVGQLVNLVLAIPILLCLALYYGLTPHVNWLVAVPLLIIIQFAVTLGISLALAMVNAYFRDLQYLVGVGLNLLFWLTPIIYPLDRVPEAYRSILVLNPIMYLISSWRTVFLSNLINWPHVGIAAVTALVFLSLGVSLFMRLGGRLDEVL